MASYDCGAQSCPTHSDPDHRCTSGTWRCRRTQPSCGTHRRPEDQCPDTAGSTWSCRAEGCPGHEDPDHRCTEVNGQAARWRCGLLSPTCPGHRSRDHRCSRERTRAREAAAQGSDQAAGSACPTCPIAQRVRVVDLVEVTYHGGEWHKRPVSARKQYINLDDESAPSQPAHDHGRVIYFMARVEWQEGEQAHPVAPVYFYATAHSDNRAGLTGDDRPGFLRAGSGAMHMPSTAVRGWTEPMPFYLSRYGGDRFKIWATTDSAYAGGESGGWYTVWRRMWYQIVEMARPGGGRFEMPSQTLQTIRASYRDVYVEMISAGATREGEHVDNFETHGAGYDWADHFVNRRGVPWKVVYSVIDHACPLSRRRRRAFSLSCTQDDSSPADTRFRPYDFGGREWLIKAKYRRGNDWLDFPSGAVTLQSPGARRTRIRIRFSSDTQVQPSVQGSVEVQIEVYEAPAFNGWGGANLHLLICRGVMNDSYTASQVPDVMAGTGVHEPGHALGLVRAPLPWETTDSDHSSHCRYEHDCVMWFQGYVGRPHTFHDESVSDPGCHTFVRGKNMERDAMSLWRFPRN
ncbi:MAG: hypothetical protein R3B72_27860 [Polyangiaceae bacterium]